MKTPRFFGYARKSPGGITRKHADPESTPSTERQCELIRVLHSKAPDTEWVGVFQEVESAASLRHDERPQWIAMMKVLEKGDHLGVWRLDRIERSSVLALFTALDSLARRGVAIHVCEVWEGLPLDLASSTALPCIAMLGFAAQIEAEHIRRAVKEGLAWLRKKGYCTMSRPPLGMKAIPAPDGTKTNMGKPRRILVWDQEQLAQLAELRSRRFAGEPCLEIAQDWQRRGLRDQVGKLWVKPGPITPAILRRLERAQQDFGKAVRKPGFGINEIPVAPPTIEDVIPRPVVNKAISKGMKRFREKERLTKKQQEEKWRQELRNRRLAQQERRRKEREAKEASQCQSESSKK